MKKYVLAPALAALAMFVFGAVYWMSPFPYTTTSSTTNPAGTGAALAQIFPATGVYLVPSPAITDEKVLSELYRQGPSAVVYYMKEGHEMMEPAVFVKGYVHYFAVALLLMIMLNSAAPLFRSLFDRVKFAAAIGGLGALQICFSDPIWWHHPWGWHLVDALYVILEFALAGLVLAKFTVHKPAA
jgi:hypothetical protein